MHLISASSMARTFACPASLVLPREPQGETAAARRGTAIHRYIATAMERGREAALAETSHKKTCERINIEALRTLLGNRTFHFELPFAYDIATDTAQKIAITERAYPAFDGEVYGTADIVIETAKDLLTVYDIKSGQSVGSPRKDAQLATLALMAARAFSAQWVQVGIVYVAQDGSLSLDDDNGTALLGPMQHDDTAERIQLAIASAPAALPVTGDHCRWCCSKPHCPAMKEAA